MDFAAGQVLLIDKPYEWTSFDVVKKIRYAIKVKKVGHAGTLDPLATGLLIVCTGKMTKQIESFQAQQKEYIGDLVLGKTTPSIDLETDFDQEYPTDHITEEMIADVLQRHTGEIQQIPPIYSAIKVNGKRLYKHARKGEVVEIEPRPVQVESFEIIENQFPTLKFRVVCSKGTYIRSLVRDVGEALKSGAYMSALQRTRIGDFRLEEAWDLMDFVEQYKVSK